MNGSLVIVADSRRARFYDVERVDAPRAATRLIERAELSNPDFGAPGKAATGRPPTETNTNRGAGPVHPIAAQRERHRLELDHRFGRDIAREAGSIAGKWKGGMVLLVAESRMLGLLREPLRAALPAGVELKELAKDYAQLPIAELQDRLFDE